MRRIASTAPITCYGADAKGYETLLNTDLKRELEQLGRFLSLVVEYKHKIGFKGVILVEPKPQPARPPTKPGPMSMIS